MAGAVGDVHSALEHSKVKSDRHTGRHHAVVIGASMAGLLAARVLCDRFEKVTLIERDRNTNDLTPRPGVPQGQHLHTLLVKGEQIIERLFPQITTALEIAGATRIDLSNDMLWFQEGLYKTRFDSGIAVLFMSRPLLEQCICRRVRALSNLTYLGRHTVKALLSNAKQDRVTGVTVQPCAPYIAAYELAADLVVDTTGRRSKSPDWLELMGYERPKESAVTVNVGYTTRIYQQDPALLPNAKGIFTMPNIPQSRRGGGLAPIEGDRWMVTLVGWLGERAPANEAGFLSYAKSLANLDIYNVIRHATSLSGFRRHHLASNLRRHYEKMTRFPNGYLVMGDAMCSFNPVYGQGMSVSAMEAVTLGDCLDNCLNKKAMRDSTDLAKAFFRQAAGIIANPWTMAVGEDFRFPEVTGHRPIGARLVNRYLSAIHRTAATDKATTSEFFKVMTLTQPPKTLFYPPMLLRVAKGALIGKK